MNAIQTKAVPDLRFPEFGDVWSLVRLGDVTSDVMYGMNSAATAYDGQNKYIRITDIDDESRAFVPDPLTTPDGELTDRYRLKLGDMVFARTGASVGKSYLYRESDGDLYYAGFLIKFTVKKANAYFVYANTFTHAYKKWVAVMSMRSGQPGINAEEYKVWKFGLPSQPEQKKIADFLSVIDKKIQQLSEKHRLLTEYKKGVMQQIFSQQIRFKDDNGQPYPDWEEKKLNQLLYEHKIRNMDMRFDKQEVLSVSGDQGIVNQIKLLGRSYAGESVANYHVVHEGDIVYTKSPLKSNPYGIIKVNKGSAGIVSTLYAVYSCKENVIGAYLDYYFQLDDNTNRYLRPLVHKGAKNDMKINNAHALTGPIVIPSKREQERIVEFLQVMDEKVRLANLELQEAQAFKKGLLQQMFV